MLKDQDILYLGMNAWDSIVQRPQHLARGLSLDNRVLYVDPTAFSVLTRLRLGLHGTGSERGWRPRLRRLSGSLSVFTPPPQLPLSLWSPTLNRLNAEFTARMLSRVFRELQFHPRFVWASSPQHLSLVKRLKADRVCYDCLDNVSAFYPHDRRGALMKRQEEKLLQTADVVFATEKRLAEKCGTLCRNVHLLPNAVHPGFLKPSQAPCPPDLAALPRPMVGYVGALDRWIDFDLIRHLAEARPGWSFVLIGPGSPGEALRTVPNIHLLGQKAHGELPAYLDRFDACLIPFRDSELTRAVNPVKLYEYLARGRPVVATETPALAHFAHVCSLCGSRREFLNSLQQAVDEEGIEKEKRARERIRFAEKNTWPHRTDKVRKILGDLAG